MLNGTLSAGLAAGEVVRIYDGATPIGTANVVGTTWTFALPTLLNGSSHSYTARVEDAAGNQGTASSAFTLTVDTSAPTQTVTIASYTDNWGSSTGNFGSGPTTDDVSPVLNGTLSAGLAAGEMVRIYDGSTPARCGFGRRHELDVQPLRSDRGHAQLYSAGGGCRRQSGNVVQYIHFHRGLQFRGHRSGDTRHHAVYNGHVAFRVEQWSVSSGHCLWNR